MRVPDKQLLLTFALDAFDRVTSIVASLDDETANSDLGLPGSNSPYQILAHCLGMMRHWSSTVARGVPVPRDREAEFTASGPVPALLEQAAYARAAFVDDVAALDLDAAPADPRDRTDFYGHSNAGVLLHVLGELTQHLGHLEITRDALAAAGHVRQLRLVVEADDYDRAVTFYRDALGMRHSASHGGAGDARGVLLEAGRATLELNTPAMKRAIDLVEVGHPTDSPIRVALQVPDTERLTHHLVDAGALVVGQPVTTPWGSINARLQAPGGLELTVFQER